MADESTTHLDGEVKQECRPRVNELPSSRIPLEKRAKYTSTASIYIRYAMLEEVFTKFLRHIAWLKSSRQPMTPLESQQKDQQEESSILFANNWDSGQYMRQSYICQSSLHRNESISTQSSAAEASYQSRQLAAFEEAFSSALMYQVEEYYKLVAGIEEEHDAKKSFESLNKLCLWIRSKPDAEESISRAPFLTINYEYIGTQPHSQSYQNLQSQFSYKTWLLWKKKKKETEKQAFLNSLKDSICSGLEYLTNILNLVSTTMHLLSDANIPLNTIQDELLEWLKKIELVSDRLLENLRRVPTQVFIYAVIFFWLFDEFPNGIRDLCTTMPWTIWPALVVLWGVCWMFHSGPVLCAVVEAERPLPADQQEQLLDFQGDLCYIDYPLFGS